MIEIGFYRKPRYITSFSRYLKHNQTRAETILWNYLKSKRFYGFKFHRQKPIFAYREESWIDRFFIADFYHHPSKLIIEIDGSIHHKKENKEYDKLREYLLQENWYRIIRFTNNMVQSNLLWVLERIKSNIIS